MSLSTYKAERRTIYLGDIPLQVAMLPNGEYCLSQTEVAGVIDKFQSSINHFLRSKSFNSNWGKAFELTKFPKTLSIEGTNKPITPIPIKLACLFWQKWAESGNEKAKQLVWALLDQTICDLADKAFSVKRTTEEKNRVFKENLATNPIDYLQFFKSDPNNVLDFPSKETPNNRELELLIELAQLGLEKIKSLQDSYDPKEIHKLGAFKPEVLIDIKDKLKLKTTEEAEQFLEESGFGKDSDKWVSIKVSGSMSVLSWNRVKELRKICSATKLRRNQQSTER